MNGIMIQENGKVAMATNYGSLMRMG